MDVLLEGWPQRAGHQALVSPLELPDQTLCIAPGG
jgi:hypothetical protein